MSLINVRPGTFLGFGKRGPIYNIGGGSDPTPEPGQDQFPTGGFHPSWSELVQAIPTELHEKVVPIVQKMSKSVDGGFQRYTPYKEFIDSGIDPEVLRYGLNIYQSIEQNPVQVLEALIEATNYEFAPGKVPTGTDDGSGDEPPDYEVMLNALRMESQERDEVLAEYMLKQREDQLNQEAQAELDSEMAAAHKKYKDEKGLDFDDYFVLTRYGSGVELEDAINQFYEWAEGVTGKVGPKPPVLLGTGGSIPSGKPDMSKASKQDLNSYVVQVLQGLASQK